MMHLAARAQALIDAGYYLAPANGYTLLAKDVDPRRTPYTAAEAARADLNIYHGVQRDGRYLAKIDLDSHHAGQDADAARAALEAALPHVARRICWQRSTSGRGWWGWVRTTKRLPDGKIYDANGQHLGELLSSDNSRSLDPGDITPDTFRLTELEHLLSFWTVRGADPDGERWADRAAEGLRYLTGAYRYHYTEADLVRFLRTYAKKINPRTGEIIREIGEDYLQGNALAPVPIGKRSDRAGNLMQTIMLFIRRAYPNAGFLELCQRSYALWRAADSFGKAYDKDYTAERDGASLLAQIIHGDSYQNGERKWGVPLWATSHPTPTPQPEPEPTPAPAPRAAHRPAGDKEKQIGKLKRILERWQFESAERIYYYVGDLAELLKVERRAAQNYLKALQDNNQIERGQDRGRGGRAWLILLPAFWGAQNSENAPEIASESTAVWGAQSMPIEAITTPKNADPAPQCKVDHQNLCAPTLKPEPESVEPAGPRVLFTHGRWLLRWPNGAAQWFGSEDAARAEIEWGSTRAWLESDEGQAMLQRCAGGRRSRAVGVQGFGALLHEPRQHQVRALRNRLVLGKAARTVRRL